MRELTSGQMLHLLTQDNQIKQLIDEQYLEKKGGIKGTELLDFDQNMAISHLNI